MSPVSKGRKRKPGKGGRKPGARRERQGLPSPFFDEQQPVSGFEVADYVGDMSPVASKAQVLETLERRTFTMPYYGTTIRGEDFPKLDPSDPDERNLLIEGEHPEYHEALGDPAFDGELDGVNPRLHLTMHQVIANQLWADDPPEVWQAARRLGARGIDRHDVLHELCAVLIEHMNPVLAHKEPFDLDAYRRELHSLGRDIAAARPSGETYQIKIAIVDSDPMIWRRLSLPGDLMLDELHRVIQNAFGWEGEHLHVFEAKGLRYGDVTYRPLEDVSDERKTTLATLAPRKGSRLRYTYDFGDNWVHDVVVEATEPTEGDHRVVCLAAERAGPPEDSGGAWGYRYRLESAADPKHPEHWDSVEWLGEDFDPAAVNLDAINARLARIRISPLTD